MQSYQRTRKSARSNTQRSSVPYVSELAQFSRAGDRVCMLADRVAPETDCARVAFAADTGSYFRRFPGVTVLWGKGIHKGSPTGICDGCGELLAITRT